MNMKAYKLTYYRMGENESWAGWRIAGRSDGTPADIADTYYGIQSANTAAAVEGLYNSSPTIWELISDGKNVFFSKLQYGLIDQSTLRRPAMRSDGIAAATTENSDIAKDISALITADESLFENRLVIETLYPDMISKGNSTANLSEEDVYTKYDQVSIDSKTLDIVSLANKYFPDRKILSDVIKCVYFSITKGSSTTVNLIYGGSDREMKEIIALIMNLIPISFRIHLSFRTMNIPEAKPTKVAFSGSAQNCTYIDIKTGENNIIAENKLDIGWTKYDFIDYAVDNLGKSDLSKYFDLLHKTMGEFGDASSIDLNFLKIAHDIVADEYMGSVKELSKEALLKKFNSFLSLPFNNERSDAYCASLLEKVLKSNITLPESIQERLQTKLTTTRSEKLKNVGYSYTAGCMIKSANRKKEFTYLYSLTKNREFFNTMLNKLFAIDGGADFVDEFYGSYYGPIVVKDMPSLDAFEAETKELPARQISAKFVMTKCKDFGFEIVDRYYSGGALLRMDLDKYSKYVQGKFPSGSTADDIFLKSVKVYFWSKFDISEFKYSEKDNYDAVLINDNSKCTLVYEIINLYSDISKGSVVTVNEFLRIITDTDYDLSEEEKSALIIEFRSACMRLADADSNIDFWFVVANLNKGETASFIVDNKIPAFCNIELFRMNLYDSKFFNKIETAEKAMQYFENYEESTVSVEIVKELRKFIKEKKRETKEQERQQAKAEKAARKTQNSDPYDEYDSSDESDYETCDQETGEKKKSLSRIVNNFFGKLGKK